MRRFWKWVASCQTGGMPCVAALSHRGLSKGLGSVISSCRKDGHINSNCWLYWHLIKHENLTPGSIQAIYKCLCDCVRGWSKCVLGMAVTSIPDSAHPEWVEPSLLPFWLGRLTGSLPSWIMEGCRSLPAAMAKEGKRSTGEDRDWATTGSS